MIGCIQIGKFRLRYANLDADNQPTGDIPNIDVYDTKGCLIESDVECIPEGKIYFFALIFLSKSI